MPDIQEFKDATILQNADVSEIITSLALAVAKAQSKLDENTFDQFAKFEEYKFEGKSLLELGFIPAFYNLSEATFSTNICLKMASKEEFDTKENVNANYSDGNSSDSSGSSGSSSSSSSGGNNSENTQTNTGSHNTETPDVNDYKSGKTISFLAAERNTVKVEGKEIEFNPKEGDKFKKCKEMKTAYKKLLYEVGAVVSKVKTNVTINQPQIQCGKYLVICDTGDGYLYITERAFKTGSNVTVFKYTDDIGANMSDMFQISEKGFEETLKSIAKSKNVDGVYAFSKEGYFYDFVGEGEKQTLKETFDLSVEFSNNYTELESNKGTKIQTTDKFGIMASVLSTMLNTIEEQEPIIITGYTIKSDDAYIKSLGDLRAEALSSLMQAFNIKKIDLKSGIDTEGNKAKITFSANYIIFSHKEGTLPSGDNRFLATDKDKKEGEAQIAGVNIPWSEEEWYNAKMENIITFIENNDTLKNQYLFEYNDFRMICLLHKKAKLSYQVLSKESNNIKIEAVANAEGDNSVVIKEDFSTTPKQPTENSTPTAPTTPTTPTSSTSSTSSNSSNSSKSTFAIGASIDVRYARQFEMSEEGNTSISATIRSIDPPEALKAFILNKIN